MATSSVNWITFPYGSSGDGSGGLYYSVSTNTGASSRTGTLTIADQTFTVTQEAGGGNCSVTLSPASRTVNTNGGGGYVVVNAESACIWTAVASDSWIKITYGSTGKGYGAVYYSVSANTSATRTGTITINGKTFTVTQSGK